MPPHPVSNSGDNAEYKPLPNPHSANPHSSSPPPPPNVPPKLSQEPTGPPQKHSGTLRTIPIYTTAQPTGTKGITRPTAQRLSLSISLAPLVNSRSILFRIQTDLGPGVGSYGELSSGYSSTSSDTSLWTLSAASGSASTPSAVQHLGAEKVATVVERDEDGNAFEGAMHGTVEDSTHHTQFDDQYIFDDLASGISLASVYSQDSFVDPSTPSSPSIPPNPITQAPESQNDDSNLTASLTLPDNTEAPTPTISVPTEPSTTHPSNHSSTTTTATAAASSASVPPPDSPLLLPRRSTSSNPLGIHADPRRYAIAFSPTVDWDWEEVVAGMVSPPSEGVAGAEVIGRGGVVGRSVAGREGARSVVGRAGTRRLPGEEDTPGARGGGAWGILGQESTNELPSTLWANSDAGGKLISSIIDYQPFFIDADPFASYHPISRPHSHAESHISKSSSSAPERSSRSEEMQPQVQTQDSLQDSKQPFPERKSSELSSSNTTATASTSASAWKPPTNTSTLDFDYDALAQRFPIGLGAPRRISSVAPKARELQAKAPKSHSRSRSSSQTQLPSTSTNHPPSNDTLPSQPSSPSSSSSPTTSQTPSKHTLAIKNRLSKQRDRKVSSPTTTRARTRLARPIRPSSPLTPRSPATTTTTMTTTTRLRRPTTLKPSSSTAKSSSSRTTAKPSSRPVTLKPTSSKSLGTMLSRLSLDPSKLRGRMAGRFEEAIPEVPEVPELPPVLPEIPRLSSEGDAASPESEINLKVDEVKPGHEQVRGATSMTLSDTQHLPSLDFSPIRLSMPTPVSVSQPGQNAQAGQTEAQGIPFPRTPHPTSSTSTSTSEAQIPFPSKDDITLSRSTEPGRARSTTFHGDRPPTITTLHNNNNNNSLTESKSRVEGTLNEVAAEPDAPSRPAALERICSLRLSAPPTPRHAHTRTRTRSRTTSGDAVNFEEPPLPTNLNGNQEENTNANPNLNAPVPVPAPRKRTHKRYASSPAVPTFRLIPNFKASQRDSWAKFGRDGDNEDDDVPPPLPSGSKWLKELRNGGGGTGRLPTSLAGKLSGGEKGGSG
ncbi:hypothetical protein CC2G_007999 [Coprinopsis cinerea AmutBmut pab1-1]|nr:hypothetical protein CC2G_007999 [Coprinopsis cinerea AmutBmut pab1-1]